VDKPAGPTSHDVVARVRRVFRERSVGHTGTLDPFATGLLVVLLGRATRLARFLDDRPKTYRATVRLGQGSDTDDATGRLGPWLAGRTVAEAEVRTALAGFVGTYPQRPPAYSAKRVQGERAYALAREGRAPELPPVAVTVHAAELLGYAAPDADIRVTVSAGTYVRALARDLGERLGLPAHCAALRREAIGELRVDDAIPLDALDAGHPLLTPARLLRHLPPCEVSAEEVAALGHGRRIRTGAPVGRCAALADGRLIAVGITGEDGWFQPEVVLEAA
jgi:tRNA pseudouridine55 synthase